MPQLKIIAGKYYKYINLEPYSNDSYKVTFGYDTVLVDEIKNMEGAQWKPEGKFWTIKKGPRNKFALEYLCGKNPYEKWEKPVQSFKPTRDCLMTHQVDMFCIGMSHQQVILAAEPGCIAGDTMITLNNIPITIKEAYRLYIDKWQTFYAIRCYNEKDAFAYTPALNIIFKGNKQTLTITTFSGKKLRCTYDHKILTDQGYIPAIKLISNHRLVTIDGYESVINYEESGYSDVYDIVCDDPYHNFVANGIVVHNCGKTLSAIEIMEHSGFTDWLWVGPKSALRAVEQEFDKWKSLIFPTMVTYDGLKKIALSYSGPAYKGVIFDEAQKLRNITTQRYQAAKHLTDSMRLEYPNPYIIELTGTPAPHDPSNWFGLCEVACPGWIKEGHPNKLKKRLALIKQKESLVGGFFPELVTWWDNENKCRICGQLKDDPIHNIEFSCLGYEYHEFEKSINEIEKLYYRLKGLVTVWLKKDVLKELPDKIFRIIRCEPSPEVLRAAKLIVTNAKNVVSGIILLRELSDGFQYQAKEIGTKVCSLCKGKKTIVHQDINEPLSHCPSCVDDSGLIVDFRCLNCGMDFSPEYNLNEEMTCPLCSGEGEIPEFEREAVQIDCPKVNVVKELLDEYDEIGRIVFYAGFQGSVDRLCETVKNAGWEYMKVDGRGWFSSLGNVSDGYMLKTFQDKTRKIPRFAYIANPDAGGLGLTLTESPVEIFYSNSHAPESRMQALERGHRPGMDLNKGLTIIDIIHLASDEKVLENLNRSQKLQALTLGDFAKLF